MRLAEAATALSTFPVDLISTRELTLFLRCHRGTVERMVARRVLKPIRVGRCWRFDRAEVIAALRSGEGDA